jgi:predicted amidophosphoribosyltransferase
MTLAIPVFVLCVMLMERLHDRPGFVGDPPVCSACGYSLRGNESGVCSECGAGIVEARRTNDAQ